MLLNALLPMAATIDKTAFPEETRAATPSGKAEGICTMRTKHVALRKLEAAARIELLDMRSAPRGNNAHAIDDSLIRLGLAWDMGLTGSSLVDVAPTSPSAEPAAARAIPAATTDPSSGTDEIVLPDPH